ncbi:MAG: lipopolysaccharide biosynthesis protein [Marinilabiliaceae bacterium]|nr:lipopolysaccharide biosynthesis protein [Marinilabiliaceae bacterium]
MNFKKKSINAIKWSFIDKLFKRGSKFLVAVILARLLVPADFGLLAMAMVFLGIGNIFADFGLGQAIIQADNVSDKQCSTIFFINLATGFAFVAIFVSISGLIADFYGDDRLENIVKVISFSYLLNSVNLVQNMRFYRRLDFKTMTLMSVISDVASGIFGIVLAYQGYGVWSLVFQRLSRTGLYTILIWSKSRWIPQLYFNFREIKDMFNFGVSMLGIGVLGEIFNYLDTILMGKFLSASFLGLFDRGKSFPTFMKNTFILPITRPLFPIFSKVKQEKDKLRKTSFSVLRNLDPLLFLGFGLMAVFSEEIILIVLNEKWLEAVPYLRIFAFATAFASIYTVSTSLYKALGKKKLLLVLSFSEKFLQLGFLLLGIFVNINYYLYGIVGVMVLAVTARLYFNNQFIGGEWMKYSARYVIFAALSLSMIGLKQLLGNIHDHFQYLVIPIFTVLYTFFFYAFVKEKMQLAYTYVLGRWTAK